MYPLTTTDGVEHLVVDEIRQTTQHSCATHETFRASMTKKEMVAMVTSDNRQHNWIKIISQSQIAPTRDDETSTSAAEHHAPAVMQTQQVVSPLPVEHGLTKLMLFLKHHTERGAPETRLPMPNLFPSTCH